MSTTDVLADQEGSKGMVMEAARSLLEQGRAVFLADSPVLYVIGYIVVLYLAFYFITFHIGPALFGRGGYYKRSFDASGLPEPMMIVHPTNTAKLTSDVYSALEKQM